MSWSLFPQIEQIREAPRSMLSDLPCGKIVLLLDWPPPPDWPLTRELQNRFRTVVVHLCRVPDGYNGNLEKMRLLWGNYIRSTWQAFWLHRDADVVFAWQPVLGLFYALLCRIFRRHRVKILVSHLIIPERKKLVQRLRITFIRACVKRISCITVSSKVEVSKYATALRLQPGRVIYLPLGIDHSALQEWQNQEYIFSGGRSNRDYATLIKAVEKMPVTVKIAAQRHNLDQASIPKNVQFICGVFGSDFDRLIAEAKLVVLPLDRADESSGHLVLLRAMYFGKAVIISDNAAIRDYVTDRENVFIVNAHDPVALTGLIQTLLRDDGLRNRIGQAARRHVLQHYMFDQTSLELVRIIAAAK